MAKRKRLSTPGSEVNNLIDEWGKELSDEEFLEALETMIDNAQTALDARHEELEKK